jgi:Ca-activated chloride channel family protein
VILCTDGDFNVGITDQAQLIKLIQQTAKTGVFLTTLGVGTDNYKDALMQRLADKGNGNYHYLDNFEEAQKVLVEQMNPNLVTIAKDVKFQVEFNPAQVSSYRLIGYEKRVLRNRDFNDDTKDAGEVGAGHCVTAFYEVIPTSATHPPVLTELKYQRVVKPLAAEDRASAELLTLQIRYKRPQNLNSERLDFSFVDSGQPFASASDDFRFAAAVVNFGMLLKNSSHLSSSAFEGVMQVAGSAKGSDVNGYRAEFITLAKKAKELMESARPLQ